ncbi:MAG: chloride channel protein [Eubacterium sp.]|nr:chloride channel protein [Eubacterium sp.]
MKEKEKSTFRKIEYHKKESFYLIVRGLEVGVVAGLVSVLYRFILKNAESLLLRAADFAKESTLKCVVWFIILALMGLAVTKIVKWEPMSSGSGIPQVNGEIKGNLSQSWWRVILAKLIGGTLSILSGLSLGREGPSIQLGAMAGKGTAKITKADKTTELRMISCGGGAGLAAAFNAPLAGVMFMLEEIHRTIDKSIICMGIVACITADFISKIFFGQDNIFTYETANIPLRYYWLLVILGALLGLLGCGYNIIMSKGQDLFKKLTKIPAWVKMIVVFIISGVVALFIPEITGGGHEMVLLLLKSKPELSVLIFLLAAKFIFSVISFGSGAPGGIFFPLLILGTYIGAIFANIVIPLFNLNENLWQEFVVIAMAGIFASIVRAPLTGIILVFEMTGNLESLLPLATVSLISYAIANLIGVNPIYETLLEKILNSDPKKPEFHNEDEKVLKTYVIPVGSSLRKKKIMDIDWGKHCLVVSVERNDVSITPKGETVLKEGDELVILVSQRRFSKDNERLEKIING